MMALDFAGCLSGKDACSLWTHAFAYQEVVTFRSGPVLFWKFLTVYSSPTGSVPRVFRQRVEPPCDGLFVLR